MRDQTALFSGELSKSFANSLVWIGLLWVQVMIDYHKVLVSFMFWKFHDRVWVTRWAMTVGWCTILISYNKWNDISLAPSTDFFNITYILVGWYQQSFHTSAKTLKLTSICSNQCFHLSNILMQYLAKNLRENYHSLTWHMHNTCRHSIQPHTIGLNMECMVNPCNTVLSIKTCACNLTLFCMTQKAA